MLFMGELDDRNVVNLITILNCFYLVSGLRINLQKLNLYGVGTTMQDVEEMDVVTGCSGANNPFFILV